MIETTRLLPLPVLMSLCIGFGVKEPAQLSRCSFSIPYSCAQLLPGRTETLCPVAAADRINNQLNAATVGKLHQNWQPVLVAIIDRMIEAALAQEFMLARTRRSVSCRSNFLCDIQGGQSNSAAGVVNQYRLA